MRAGCFLRRLKYDMCFIFDYCPIGHCANLSHDIEGSVRFERSFPFTVGMIGYLPKVVSPVLSYSWIILSFGDYLTRHGRSSYGVASIRLSEFGGALDPDQSAIRLVRPQAKRRIAATPRAPTASTRMLPQLPASVSRCHPRGAHRCARFKSALLLRRCKVYDRLREALPDCIDLDQDSEFVSSR
jgi:hypothetical protein